MFNNSILVSQRMADYLWEKQQVTLNNIANVSTPGYKAQYVTFQDELKNKLASYNQESASKIRNQIDQTFIKVHTKEDESSRLDGNNVNMDVEQVELASSYIQYQMTINNINSEFDRIRSALK
ncbi:flagellar basal body rod protein FlgB [Anaerotignum neopropionicum]|uniref:Flagellar basal body rod protein FlgB n=1 Tax=Anaerotignum neopropionicum TaxID=36847 RepID=A0A136WJ51_9FIRM|nr:flagellar basal body rod protein FlgB [Anaerotignum neopropionicum]KXL54494.1 flagellar basal body rod protein FlgB [Anaerotignum neopropionicum]